MSYTKFGLLLCSGLLACSGRYVSNPEGTDVDVGAASATGGKSSGKGGQASPQEDPPIASAGVGVPAGGSQMVGPVMPIITDTACGVPVGQPAAIEAPISNYMMWWTRLSKLIWAAQPHAPPPDLPFVISHEQAGQLADDAIDQAIAETKGIPGVEPFMRHWLHLQDPKAQLTVDWNSVLTRGAALESLLNLPFAPMRVGAFTEPDFLTMHRSISSRGAAMVEALFAQRVPPPPPGLPPLIPPAGLTRREALAQSVGTPACAGCHNFLDPFGFSLGNYDESGNYVSTDAGKPIDASGTYPLPWSGGQLDFDGIQNLARQLTNSCDANLGFADEFLMFALEQSGAQTTYLEGYEADAARLRQAFMRSGGRYRSLIRAFAQSQAIRANY